ncbi:hypothetical protein JCM8097_009419 [Rhodosporidiobolus ruineniae]
MPRDRYGDQPEEGWTPNKPRPFATPFDQISVDEYGYTDDVPSYLEAPWSLQEIAMFGLSDAIRSKPEWWIKRKDAAIRAKWKREAMEQGGAVVTAGLREDGEEEGTAPEESGTTRLTEGMVEYVLDELEWHEKQLDDPNGIQASCFDKIFTSDTIVPSELRNSLIAAATALEADPPFGQPDWHPGSNEQVLDLVHPSLFPLRYGVTPVRSEGEDGKTKVEAAPEARNAEHSRSKKFQWLPSDVQVNENGEATFSSYINNLHPDHHAPFYPVLSSLLTRFLPLFERVLSSLQRPAPRRIEINYDVASSWYGAEYEGDEDADDYWDKYEEFMEKRELRLPEPEKFDMGKKEEWAKKEVEDGPAFPLKGRKLQVITKIASIHLTPEKPSYGGGVWHVEGMQNEEIVASGIYYFDQENITESQLAFRGTFSDDLLPYEQSDDRGVKGVFGIVGDGPCIQYYNSLTTSKGRSICFPNIYQHRVSPFSLADPSKPGYRKILVFFLVDPLKTDAGEVISTAQVPYQQREWVREEIEKTGEWEGRNLVGELPREMWDKILDDTDGLMSFDEAKKVREELMHERKFLVKENNDKVFERSFSLCEH